MTPTDSGPLVALEDRKDPFHPAAVRAVARLPVGPLVTTWPCFTEAMHLLGRSAGFAGQDALWGLLAAGRLVIRDPGPGEAVRMAELMRKYRDRPMDLADASLVAAAEATRNRRIFTFDGDFRIYRLADGSSFDIVPDPDDPTG